MPDIEQGQTESAAAPFVELSTGDFPLASEDETATAEPTDTAEATETEAGDEQSSESAADAAEESPEPPTAESLGLDLSLPKDKAAYAELVKKWGQWSNKLHAKLKTKPETNATEAPATPATEQQAAPSSESSGDPIDEFYDLSAWTPKFREGSELSDYADELKDLFAQAAQHLRDNDQKLRQTMTVQQQEQQATKVVGAYLQQVADHPEFQEKAAGIRQFAKETEGLLRSNPERWVRLAAAEFDLQPDWRGEVEAEQQRTGQANQRLATKVRSTSPPTRRPTTSRATQPTGEMSFDDAVEEAMRKAGL